MQKVIYKATIQNLTKGTKFEILFPSNAASANFVEGEIFCPNAMKKQILRGLKNNLNRMEEVPEMNEYDPWIVGETLTKNITKILKSIIPDCMYQVVGFEEEKY